MPMNLMLTGPRGAGKSTVIARALELIPEAHVGGYVTERIGPRARPEGHLLRDLAGPEAMIAHRDMRSGPRFGPYRVDLSAFETVGAAALRAAREGADIVVADEIGRMEEGAPGFRAELLACLDSPKPFLAALSDRGGEAVEAILGREGVRVIEVTDAGRDLLPRAIATALRWELLGAEGVDVPAATAVILAGGRGSRLSPDKGWLEVAGVPIVERVLEVVRPLVQETVVAGEAQVAARLGTARVADEIPGAGPLAGIAAGLAAASTPLILVAAWDMPFLSPALGAHMLTLAADFDAVVPRTERGAEPLFAVYHRSCLESARAILAAGGRRPQELLESVNTRWVEGPELGVFGDPEVLFFSVNAPRDLAKAQAIASSSDLR